MTVDREITPYDDVNTLSEAEWRERVARQLDHIDSMVHDLHRTLTKYEPLLDTVSARIDPGKGWRTWRAKGNGQHERD